MAERSSWSSTARIGIALTALSVIAMGVALAQPGPFGRSVRGRGDGPPPPEGQPGDARVYDMEQTLSEGAQLHTIAFSGFAFLTGTLGADSFFPPGKVADWWGFQHLRDNDPSQLGHNTDFLTKAAHNMLYVLSEDQRARLVALAQEQVAGINAYALQRFPLMVAFRRQLTGEIPAGTLGLDRDAVCDYSAALYRLDGEMSLRRAEVMGAILHEMDADQNAYLAQLRGTGMATWPDVPETIDRRALPHDVHVAVMTYAGDMFAWYMGDIEADVYYCPERQGTYFGGFYLKDAPAMGNPDYTISDRLTGDVGARMIDGLGRDQARPILDLVPVQRPLLEEITDVRRQIATELRRYIEGEQADREKVLALSERYGALDGAIVYGDAMAFAEVAKGLTQEQYRALVAMRQQVGVGVPEGAYLYSQQIQMPEVPNTDHLFGVQ